ncbi:MAG: translocation/assembly module TamB domain-containing protein, partial [Bacteroidales bacterium]|nr:translocation/assembly module TamB domain-containing protein [Bacteroidales bacterium]
MKWLKKIVIALVGIVLIIPIIVSLAIQMPHMQTKLCQSIIGSISEKIEGDISVSAIHYALFDRLIIEDIKLTDNQQDTVAYCEKLYLNMNLVSFFSKEFVIRKIALTNGEFNLIHTSDSTTNLSAMFSKKEGVEETKSKNKEKKEVDSTQVVDLPKLLPNLRINRLEVNNFSFKRYNPWAKVPSNPFAMPSLYAVDWGNIDVSDFSLHLNKIIVREDLVSAKLENLTLREHNGLYIRQLSLDAALDTAGARVENFIYDDCYSYLDMPSIGLNLDKLGENGNFLKDVDLDVSFHDAVFDMTSLQFFLADIGSLHLRLIIDGDVHGTVDNLEMERFRIYSASRQTLIECDAHLSGLPVSEQTMATMKVRNLMTNTADIATIISQVSPPTFKPESIMQLAPGQVFNFKGSINGFFEDFVAYGDLTSDIGSVGIDAIFRSERMDGYEIMGFMKADNFNLGAFIGNKLFGDLSCDASVHLFTSPIPSYSFINLESLNIDSFNLNNYTYSGISADGMLSFNEFTGKVVSDDPNLKFRFDGKIGLSANNREYVFGLDMKHADLVAINIDKREKSLVQMKADANFGMEEDGSILGEINVSNLQCTNQFDTYDIGKIKITSHTSTVGKQYRLNLDSSFLQGEMKSDAPFSQLIPDLKQIFMKDKLDNLLKSNQLAEEYSGNGYQIHLKSKDTRPLFSYISPGIHVEHGTTIDLSLNKDATGNLGINSELIAIGNKYIRNLNMVMLSDSTAVNALLVTDLIQAGNIKAFQDTILITAADNSIDLSLSLNNTDTITNRTIFNSNIRFPAPSEDGYFVTAHIDNSHFYLDGNHWKFKESEISYKPKYISINNFGFENNDQHLLIDGVLSENREDTCMISIQNLDASMFNAFTKQNFNIAGRITGDGEFVSFFSNPGLFVDIDAENVSVSGKDAGTLCVKTKWDENNMRINYLVTDVVGDAMPLNLTGFYVPETKQIFANADIKQFEVGLLGPILQSVVTDVSGGISGRIMLDKTPEAMSITSRDCAINNLGATLDFTRASYILDGPIDIDSEGVHFRDVTIKDHFDNSGRVTGGVYFNNFKQITLDTEFQLENVLALNTTPSSAQGFYGKAFASGNVRLHGPVDQMNISVDVTPTKETSVNIPLGGTAKGATSLLTFVHVDTTIKSSYDSLILATTKEVQQKASSALNVRLLLDVNQDSEINLEVNKSTGDVLKARGNGQVEISVINNNFNIKGDYTVSEGSYRFGMLEIISRDFTLNPGGTIKFNGDIMDSDLGMSALYKTKASISPLIADTTSMTSRRNVICGLDITGKLANPQLG